jgi:hypothetical protein
VIMCKHTDVSTVRIVQVVKGRGICGNCAEDIKAKHGANAKDSANQLGGHENKDAIYLV